MKRPGVTALTLQTPRRMEAMATATHRWWRQPLGKEAGSFLQNICIFATCPAIFLFGVYMGVQNLCVHRKLDIYTSFLPWKQPCCSVDERSKVCFTQTQTSDY